MPREEARAELVRRFLRCYGPGESLPRRARRPYFDVAAEADAVARLRGCGAVSLRPRW